MAYKETDYVVCLECGRINWYENEGCVGCGIEIDNETHLNCRDMTEKDGRQLIDDFWIDEYGDDDTYIDSIEIEV